jgi:hypothetical protein
MKIETISKDAKVTLKFIGKCSKDLVAQIQEETDLQLRVVERGGGLSFSWNITERVQRSSQIIIQMYLKSELEVSGGAELDTLEVKVTKDLSI